MARVKRERDRFVGFVLDGVDRIPVEDRIVGRARFVDAHTLRVDDRLAIRATSVVVATGSSPAYPAAWKALGDRLVDQRRRCSTGTTCRRASLSSAPASSASSSGRLCTASACASRCSGAGAASGRSPIRRWSRTRGAASARSSTSTPTRTRTSPATAITSWSRIARSTAAPQVERFDYLLAATGRTPNVHGLGLENTGLALGAHGVPVHDRHTLRCGSSHVFIAGDATHDVPLLHEAADEGRIAGENAARYPEVRAGQRRAPSGRRVLAIPQIAVVGGGHAALRGIAHVTGDVSFEDQGRARVMLRQPRPAARLRRSPPPVASSAPR